MYMRCCLHCIDKLIYALSFDMIDNHYRTLLENPLMHLHPQPPRIYPSLDERFCKSQSVFASEWHLYLDTHQSIEHPQLGEFFKIFLEYSTEHGFVYHDFDVDEGVAICIRLVGWRMRVPNKAFMIFSFTHDNSCNETNLHR